MAETKNRTGRKAGNYPNGLGKFGSAINMDKRQVQELNRRLRGVTHTSYIKIKLEDDYPDIMNANFLQEEEITLTSTVLEAMVEEKAKEMFDNVWEALLKKIKVEEKLKEYFKTLESGVIA